MTLSPQFLEHEAFEATCRRTVADVARDAVAEGAYCCQSAYFGGDCGCGLTEAERYYALYAHEENGVILDFVDGRPVAPPRGF